MRSRRAPLGAWMLLAAMAAMAAVVATRGASAQDQAGAQVGTAFLVRFVGEECERYTLDRSLFREQLAAWGFPGDRMFDADGEWMETRRRHENLINLMVSRGGFDNLCDASFARFANLAPLLRRRTAAELAAARQDLGRTPEQDEANRAREVWRRKFGPYLEAGDERWRAECKRPCR